MMSSHLLIILIAVEATHQSTSIIYPPLKFTLPEFVRASDVSHFLANAGNVDALGYVDPESLKGHLEEINDGLASADMECDWSADTSSYSSYNLLPVHSAYDAVLPLLMGDGSLQSTIADLLPKLAHAASLLANSPRRYRLLAMPPTSRVVEQLVSRVAGVQVIRHIGGLVSARRMLIACRTPRMHSSLWDELRRKLDVRDQPATKQGVDGRYVILVLNTHTAARGRSLENKDELIDALKVKYGDRVKVFYESDSLDDIINLFSQATVVVGVTGPSMSNILFSPRRTRVVEIVPTLSSGTVLPVYARQRLVWRMAQTLRMTYWRRPETPLTSEGNVRVDVRLTMMAVGGVKV